MVTYSDIDPAIDAWAARHGLVINPEFGGEARRFTYVTGGPRECFQISVEPPDQGMVTVNAWDVETLDEAQLHESWTVPAGDVDSALESAARRVAAWRTRRRMVPFRLNFNPLQKFKTPEQADRAAPMAAFSLAIVTTFVVLQLVIGLLTGYDSLKRPIGEAWPLALMQLAGCLWLTWRGWVGRNWLVAMAAATSGGALLVQSTVETGMFAALMIVAAIPVLLAGVVSLRACLWLRSFRRSRLAAPLVGRESRKLG